MWVNREKGTLNVILLLAFFNGTLPPMSNDPPTPPAPRPMQLIDATLPLWYPSPKYDYVALDTDADERTPEQRARLLLHPPQRISVAVRQYLDAEARKHTAHGEYAATRAMRQTMETRIAAARRQATPDMAIEPTPVASRVHVGARRVREQLEADLEAHGASNGAALAARAADAALDDVADCMTTQRTHVVRYRRRRSAKCALPARASLTPVELQTALQPRDGAERHAHAGEAHPALALLAVARCRERRQRAAEATIRTEMAALQPVVVEWLRTCADEKFELSDGSLRLAVRAARAPTAHRLSDAAVLRVTALLFAEQQPVEVIRYVQEGLLRLGSGAAADVERSVKRTHTL
jgi:hypothetical protein